MYSIGEVFDHLFGGNGDPEWRLGYEDRRWFRRPRPYDWSAEQRQQIRDIAKGAEGILQRKIQACRRSWINSHRDLVERTKQRISDRYAKMLPEYRIKLNPLRHIPPRLPYDVFAISGHLIESAGIYHHLQPAKIQEDVFACNSDHDPHGSESPRHISITAEDRAKVTAAANAWREIPRGLLFSNDLDDALAHHIVSDDVWRNIEPLFESWFIVFGLYGKASVFLHLSSRDGAAEPAPGWWMHAWRLFAIADEAARSTAYNFNEKLAIQAQSDDRAIMSWFEAQIYLESALRKAFIKHRMSIPEQELRKFDLTTLTVAREEVLGVLPKVRTPSIGCTLRSLSHHLAITPGRGIARGRWTPNFVRNPEPAHSRPDGQMNILVVPFPYFIDANAFCGNLTEDPAPPHSAKGIGDLSREQRSTARFGYFDVHQGWLQGDRNDPNNDGSFQFLLFFRSLLTSAYAQCRDIHCVVFPELSLNARYVELLKDYIAKNEKKIEFLVTGTSEKPTNAPPSIASDGEAGGESEKASIRHGNFVAVYSFDRTESKDLPRDTIREKHHRWKLNKSQLRDYGLLGVLSPEIEWWENIQLQSRRVDFTVIRQNSVISALICEDLARVDPCQQLIRAVAPNLVVALLMDAPQRAGRWPARYATVLAEDPGSAVLTVTSRGLMARQDKLGIYPANGNDRVVAMWRDDKSEGPIELSCPYDAQAVILSVVEEQTEDISLDGRTDASAMAFRYAGHMPVRMIGSEKAKFASILGENGGGH